jgi:flagellar biosynthetic protein FlhB
VADTDDKTEAPTGKRRGEARNKGNVARSTEVNSVIVLLAGLFALKINGKAMYDGMTQVLVGSFKMIHNPRISDMMLVDIFVNAMTSAGKLIFPIAITIMVFGVAANILQVGFIMSTYPLMPRLDKLNPIAGFARLFSIRSVVEALKNILKLLVVGWVAYATIKGEFEGMLVLNNATIGGILMFIMQIGYKIIYRIGLVLILLAFLDWAYNKYDTEKNLKMSKEEVKEEHKQMEGDPKVKRRIRSMQIEMARRRMMKEVPKATVVITNPTYIAIAIRYEPEQMDTPIVLAKGKRLIAEKIREIARENSIPIVEDKPLARGMYDKVEIGSAIPVEFFTAVAEILAYVFKLKNRAAA